MRRLRSPLKNLVTLLALAAVLLGTLEHEDLIFQEPGAAPLAADADAVDDFSSPRPDAGTEGVFRSDPQRFWLNPRFSPVRAASLHATASLPHPGPVLPPPARHGFIGLVALRL